MEYRKEHINIYFDFPNLQLLKIRFSDVFVLFVYVPLRKIFLFISFHGRLILVYGVCSDTLVEVHISFDHTKRGCMSFAVDNIRFFNSLFADCYYMGLYSKMFNVSFVAGWSL